MTTSNVACFLALLGIAGCGSDAPPHIEPIPRDELVAEATRQVEECDAWLTAHPADPGRGDVLLRRGETLERLGRDEDARASYELALAVPAEDTERGLMDASNTHNRAVDGLAAIEERRGNWKGALERLEVWTPGSWCGNCGLALADDRVGRVARCRFEMGEVEPALAAVREIVVRDHSLNGFDVRAMALYAELSSRAGRLDEARATAESLDPEIREPALAAVDLAEAAFVRRSPGATLDAIRGVDLEDTEIFSDGSGHVPPIVEAAGRFLDRLGPPARDYLAERIAEGDEHAIVVAGAGGFVSLRGDLERARERESSGTTRRRIDEALFRLSRVLGG